MTAKERARVAKLQAIVDEVSFWKHDVGEPGTYRTWCDHCAAYDNKHTQSCIILRARRLRSPRAVATAKKMKK